MEVKKEKVCISLKKAIYLVITIVFAEFIMMWRKPNTPKRLKMISLQQCAFALYLQPLHWLYAAV